MRLGLDVLASSPLIRTRSECGDCPFSEKYGCGSAFYYSGLILVSYYVTVFVIIISWTVTCNRQLPLPQTVLRLPRCWRRDAVATAVTANIKLFFENKFVRVEMRNCSERVARLNRAGSGFVVVWRLLSLQPPSTPWQLHCDISQWRGRRLPRQPTLELPSCRWCAASLRPAWSDRPLPAAVTSIIVQLLHFFTPASAEQPLMLMCHAIKQTFSLSRTSTLVN